MRADQGSGVPIRELLGGLDTKTPAHRVPPGGSPDLSNVVLSGRSVERRGGFVPFTRTQPGSCSLHNPQHVVESRLNRTNGAANTRFVTVAGSAHAGHRPTWDDQDVRRGLTLDLFVQIADLTEEHGGNADNSASPYTISVRPILSKGPVKRTVQTDGHYPGTPGWQTSSYWGNLGASEHAMPFCLYLFLNGSTWELRFSFHVKRAGDWELVTLSTDLAALGGVRVGVKYHVVAGYSITGDAAVLRVGSLFDFEAPAYVTVSQAIGGSPAEMPKSTTGPIQLFDCPQEFIEAPAAASATRPPGLELDSYFYDAKRFCGSVEDIAIYRGLVDGAATGALNRLGRIDRGSPPATLLQHWPIESERPDMAVEVSGLGNHLFFAPSDPVFDGQALAFNGRTAYALCEMSDVNPVAGSYRDGRGGRPNWRTAWTNGGATTYDGTWTEAVKADLIHGLEVAFWPDSIEPNFESVVVEATGAARISVDRDGMIRFWLRNTAGTGYQAAGTSLAAVVPGRRYHVIGVRVSETSAQLYVNGNLDATTVVTGIASLGLPVGGLVVGAGAFQLNTEAVTAALAWPADRVNTDFRSHFFGRVEGLRVLVGSLPLGTTVGTSAIATAHKKHAPSDYQLRYDELVHSDSGATFSPAATTDTVPRNLSGHAVTTPQASNWSPASPMVASDVAQAFAVGHRLLAGEGGTDLVRAQQPILRRAIAAYDFDRPVPEHGYGGHHVAEAEFTSAGGVQAAIAGKWIHLHRHTYACLLGLGGDVQLRSVSSDIQILAPGALFRGAFAPEPRRSPRELAPQWAAGFLDVGLDENPITVLADWHHEITKDQFVVAGCRRSLYWVKPAWRRASPFDDGADALWLAGRPNDFARASLARASSNYTTDFDWVDLWCYPQRLDGNRVLVARGSIQGTTLRYLVFLAEGQLVVMGQTAGGGSWSFLSGAVLSAPTRNVAQVAVRRDSWNHVAVKIGEGTVLAWINGQQVAMAAASLVYGTGTFGAAATPACTDIWVGGLSADQLDLTIAAGVRVTLRPWHGYLTAVREGATALFTNGLSASPPTERPDATGARFVFPLRDATDFEDVSLVDATTLAVRTVEWIPIRQDLDDMGALAGNAVVFRQALVVAHEKIAPQHVLLEGLDQDAPFRSFRLGMDFPGDELDSYRDTRLGGTGTGNVFLANETWTVYASFVNFLGHESAAAPIATRTLPSNSKALTVESVPRSLDPQVGARRIYLSFGGAGPLVFVGELFGSDSVGFEIQTREGLGLPSPVTADRIPAPRARRVAVAPGALLLAGLEGNPNSVAISGEQYTYFPLARQVAIDSQDGHGVVGVAALLSSVFAMKRNGVWAIEANGIRPVNTTAGCGGGATVYDNVIYGAGERGAYAFNGSAPLYLSEAIERDFQDVDVSEAGLLAQQGAFLYPESQWWLSVRRLGEASNRTVFVFHTHAGSTPAWTRQELPAHTTLSVVTAIDARPSLVIGTSSGQILVMVEGQVCDGVRNAASLVGSAVATGNTISVASAFPLPTQLRGVGITIFSANGAVVQRTRIARATGTSLTLAEAPVEDTGLVRFAIGAFDGYWSTPWIDPQPFGSFLKAERIDLDFEPSAGDLMIDHATAVDSFRSERAFDATALEAERHEVDMTNGFRDQPIPTTQRRHGRYFRMRLGTYANSQTLPAPFAVTGFGLRFSAVGVEGKPT